MIVDEGVREALAAAPALEHRDPGRSFPCEGCWARRPAALYAGDLWVGRRVARVCSKCVAEAAGGHQG